MKALVVRSRSSEESSKSSPDEKKRSPRSEGPGASSSVWFSGELESLLLIEGSFGAITPPEEKELGQNNWYSLCDRLLYRLLKRR